MKTYQQKMDAIYFDNIKKKKKISRLAKKNNKRELLILNFMKKTDVFYHHHNSKESLKKQVLYQIDVIKKANSVVDYVEDVHEGYVGYSNSYTSRSLLGNSWRSDEFETIYDVPLDGTYHFHVFDSGQRGLGSINGITCHKVEAKVEVPKIDTGGIIQITINLLI